MNDQPREEKAPEGADQPTVEQPTAQAGAADQPTTQQPAAAAPGQSEPATQAVPTAAQAPAGNALPTAEGTAVHGQQPPPAPPTPQLSQPGPGQAYGAWGPPQAAPRQPGGFRRFVGHRATQLVGVGVLGLLIGGGIVGGIAAATSHGPRDGRPGIHRQYDGPGQGPDGRGFPGRGGGNSGNSGDSGSGNGI
ncbi:hypothetical protein AB0C38_00995 [Amycolatopsis sp. NPDC048633]|uniref:hypothetical protein n=1 Tax=Amycolatopsis sp. NPDC048633 TaxID=3157095 RepID=UPI0033E2D1E2